MGTGQLYAVDIGRFAAGDICRHSGCIRRVEAAGALVDTSYLETGGRGECLPRCYVRRRGIAKVIYSRLNKNFSI